jgi:hypothetical protein
MTLIRLEECYAEAHNTEPLISIIFESRSQTVALRVHCRFDRRLGLCRLEGRPMRKVQNPA